jgi:hypothetical protein
VPIRVAGQVSSARSRPFVASGIDALQHSCRFACHTEALREGGCPFVVVSPKQKRPAEAGRFELIKLNEPASLLS